MNISITEVLRQHGSEFLFSEEALGILFEQAYKTKSENMLGHQKMGQAIRNTMELPYGTPFKSYNVKEDLLGILKESYEIPIQMKSALWAEKNGCASDAQFEIIGNGLIKGLNTLADSLAQKIERTFWRGLRGKTPVLSEGSAKLPRLTKTDSWKDEKNSDPIQDILDAKNVLMKKGFKPSAIMMNNVTAESMSRSEMFNKTLSQLIRSPESGIFNSPPKIAGMNLLNYDEGYIDDYGTHQNYIPDGVVIYEGEGPNGKTVGLEIFRNRNNSSTECYGSYLHPTKKEGNIDNIYHSWIGVPRFWNPEAFLSQSVF